MWDAVAWVPDLQCSWQNQSVEYAQCHDGMMRVMDGLMEVLTGTGEEKRVAHQLASLPNAIGRSRIAERGPNGPGCILGIMGRSWTSHIRVSSTKCV